jgi:imidazolonepropionase
MFNCFPVEKFFFKQTMTNCDLLIYNAGAGFDVRVRRRTETRRAMRDVGIVEKGAVAVKDGLIIAVGKSAEIEREYKAKTRLTQTEKSLAPGFVECHTHVVFAGNRF